MKRRFFSQSRATAFTLVELLVAMGVLILMMVLVTGLVNNTARLTTASHAAISADAGGREALDRIAFDLGRMVLRRDLPQKIDKPEGNDAFAFYAQAVGYEGDRGISKIGFRVEGGKLERGAQGCYWQGGAEATQVAFRQAALPDIPDGDFEGMASEVFRLEVAFLMQDGTIKAARTDLLGDANAAASDQVRAVIVAVAVLDARARQAMSGPVEGLAALFPDAEDGRDIASLWGPLLSKPEFAVAPPGDPYPQPVRAAVRVHQRTIYLDY